MTNVKGALQCYLTPPLMIYLRKHGRHAMLLLLRSLPVSALDIANRFYERNHQVYDAALLTKCSENGQKLVKYASFLYRRKKWSIYRR